MDINNHTIDKSTAEKGKWLEFDGARFLIASSQSRAYQNYIAKKMRGRNQAELKRDPSVALDITMEAMTDVVLLDWQGVKVGRKVFPPTRDNRLALLSSAPEFRDWVSNQASEMGNYREAAAEDAEAVKSSDGVGTEMGRGDGDLPADIG